jgi:hypothetical protein
MRKDRAHFLSSISFVAFYGGLMATIYCAVGAYMGDLRWHWIILPTATLVGGLASMLYFDRKWMR